MKLIQGIWTLTAATLLLSRPLAAQPLAATDPRPPSRREARPPPPVVQPRPPERHSARTVAGAPRPDQAGGIARPEPVPGSRRRAVARALLVVPRAAFWLLNAPLRGSAWVSERYQVPLRVREALFNEQGTAGLVPIARAETDGGPAGGARFVHRDLLGAGEHLVAEASWGGYRQPGMAARIDSGDRLGRRLLLRVDGRIEDRPRDRFVGIGNGDLVDAVAAPVDPYADPSAVDSTFHQRAFAVGAGGELAVAGPLAVRLSTAALWRRTGGGDIADSYQTDALPGFGEPLSSTYSQLELRLDTRDRPARSEPPGPRATGVALSLYGGAATAPAYGRHGAEGRAQLALGTRQRILVLRALAEGVSGPLAEIPFVDLPRLGGPVLLRGYPTDRFRDRAMALASAEYRFDLGDSLGGFLFTDAGRVLPGLSELASGEVRAGYGGGLDVRRGEVHLGRLSVASSIDGGLFVGAVFDPFGDPEARP